MKVLITGGAGNLARYCLAELGERGHEVTLFDRMHPTEARTPWSPDVQFVQGELTSLDDCLRAVETARAEAVINLGGIPYPTEDPTRRTRAIANGETPPPEDETFRVNVLGTYYILDAARRLGVKAFAHASTMSILGISPRLGALPIPIRTMPIDEDHPAWAENTYSLSKLMNEEMLLSFARAYGIRTVALRLMAVKYPHMPGFYQPLGEAAVPYVPGNLTAWAYVDARDAAAAFRLAIEKSGLDLFERAFIATDRTSREEHRDLVRQHYPHLAAAADEMGPDDLILTIRRARERLGYAPRHSWRGPEANARVR